MNSENALFFNNDFAIKYDEAIKKQRWYGPEILFGMVYEYLKPGQKILDLGIGTGLSAEAFFQMGLDVYGLDYSNEMLEICKQKNITADLQQFDLTNLPLPYQARSFNHICANAVLYFLPELNELFSEVSRIISEDGIWAFIVEENESPSGPKIIEKPPGKNGLVNYQHNYNYISDLITENGFVVLKKIEFAAENFQMEGNAVFFQLYVTKKSK